MEGRLEENRANMRKNGVTIETAIPLAVQQALHAAASNAVADWQAGTGDGKAILTGTRRDSLSRGRGGGRAAGPGYAWRPPTFPHADAST